MPSRINYINGQMFGTIEFLHEAPSKNNRRRGYFKCSCGTPFEANLHKVTSESTKSCGCLRKEATQKANSRHGLRGHPLYAVWRGIKTRCYDENSPYFIRYGGRGVRMCSEWVSDFSLFYEWCIANGWKNGLEIDKDIKGDGLLYSPETCSIVTRKENCNRRTTSRYIEHNGQSKTVSEWADHFGLSLKNLYQRMSRGWSFEKSITNG